MKTSLGMILIFCLVFGTWACGDDDSGNDGGMDADTDTDADADSDADAGEDFDSGAECVAECGACGTAGDTDVSPCCGEMVCVGWLGASDEASCQPEFFTDSALCASFAGVHQGAACTPLGLECTFQESDSGLGETVWDCSCQGWQNQLWD